MSEVFGVLQSVPGLRCPRFRTSISSHANSSNQDDGMFGVIKTILSVPENESKNRIPEVCRRIPDVHSIAEARSKIAEVL